MNKPFHELRRQQFLTEVFYLDEMDRFRRMFGEFADELASADTNAEGASLLHQSLSSDHYEKLSLRYTAGEPIEQLRSELTGVIEAYERYQVALSNFEEEKDTAVFFFREVGHYSRLMQLTGLTYLLHRRDLLPRLAKLVDTNFYGTDALVEELFDYELSDRVDTEQMYHPEPYQHLVHAMYRDKDAQATEDIQLYVRAWYPAMKHAPWHDGHLRMRGTEGDYFGYWAFEAGAVAYLLDLDDSAITHMVYPKDMVAWARANKHLSEEASEDIERGRCEAGQPCPREGFWFTPAQVGNRRVFKAGEVMPSVGGDYGATIWQWDQDQRTTNS